MQQRKCSLTCLPSGVRKWWPLVVVVVGLTVVAFDVARRLVASSAESTVPYPAATPRRTSAASSAMPLRPPWYPFKAQPPDGFTVPIGDVRISKAQADHYFQRRFGQFALHILNDPNELPYLSERMRRFQAATWTHNPLKVTASIGYSDPHPTAPAALHGSQETPGLAVLTFYIPLWVEYDRFFTEEYVRDTFAQAVAHELDHFDEGFWRPDRDHSFGENTKAEAQVWGKTCDHIIFPMMQQGREPGVYTRLICNQYKRLGSSADHSAFVAFIGKTATHGR